MDSRLVSVIVLAATALLVLMLTSVAGLPALMLIPVAVIGLSLMNHPVRLLAVYWGFILLEPSIELLLPGVLWKLIEQGGGLLLMVVLVLDLLLKRQSLKGVGVYGWLLLLLMVNVVLSTLANRVPATQVFFWVLIYVRPLIVFLLGLRLFNARHLGPFMAIFAASVAVQIIFNGLAYAGLNPIPRMIGRSFVDFSVGTLYSSNLVGYYMMAALFVLFAGLSTLRGGLGRRLAHAAQIVLIFVQFYLTYTLHAYPFLAVGLLWEMLMLRSRLLVGILRWAVPVLLVVGMIILLDTRGPLQDTARQIITPRKLDYEWQRSRYGTKGAAYEEVFLRSGDHLHYPLLGGGPGNYTSHIAFMNNRPLAWLEHMSYHSWASDQYRVSGGSIMTVPHTGFITMFGELGPAGFLLYWGLYGYAIVRVMRQFIRGRYDDVRQRALACAFVPAMATLVTLNTLADFALRFQLTGGMWLWAAMVWNPFGHAVSREASEAGSQTEGGAGIEGDQEGLA